MADPTIPEIMEALADQIRSKLRKASVIPDLQVDPLLNINPSPPSIDIYPADPFQEAISFGPANNEMLFTVRARVNTPDHTGAQELLLSMMDPRADTSVALAVASDRTLNGKVEEAIVTSGPGNYGIFSDPLGPGSHLGCTWTVRVTP